MQTTTILYAAALRPTFCDTPRHLVIATSNLTRRPLMKSLALLTLLPRAALSQADTPIVKPTPATNGTLVVKPK